MAARAGLLRHVRTATGVAEAPSETPLMTWSQYLPLRQQQRLASRVGAIPSMFVGTSIGVTYFASIEADPTQLILGMEPIWFYALCTLGCVGAGWATGSFLGSAGWRLLHRKALPEMEIRNQQFQQHLNRWRADPSRQSVQNPVPDYYGEKIGSLRQYRQWLRDQNAYKRKAIFGGPSKESAERRGFDTPTTL